MKKWLFLLLLACSCQQDFGKLHFEAKLPKLLKEVSGIEYDASRDAFWMLNDSGNQPFVYLVSGKGKILREVPVKAGNTDWEDISLGSDGSLYIGDFGNNYNNRKDLKILKIDTQELNQEAGEAAVIETGFSFPEQSEFPPKKKYYDVEGFFEYKGFFYIFTKSRVKNKIGRTFLYKVPNQSGNFKAKRVSDFTTCKKKGCWITGADISPDGEQVALVNHKSAWVFTNFVGDDFFSGDAKQFRFDHNSQKESITFKDKHTIYVADEEESGHNRGRNLYSLSLKSKP